MTLKFDEWYRKAIRHLLYTTSSGVPIRKRSIRVKIGDFFASRALENWRMTLKNNRAPHLYHVKLCASFHIHQWSQTWVIVQKRSIRIKIGGCFSCLTFKIWWMTSKSNRAPHLYYIKLCAAFQSHWYIQIWVTVRKCSIRVKIGDLFVPCDFENWRLTLKNSRAPLLCCFKFYASFHSHWWIQTGVTVWKRPM